MMIQSGMHGRSINECPSNDCRGNETTPYTRTELESNRACANGPLKIMFKLSICTYNKTKYN